MTQAADLVERYAARRGEWALSGRALRQLDWMGLYRQLCEGIRDADDVLLVAGIPRRAVLAWLRLAGEYGDEAGQRLGELLAGEDELLAERARGVRGSV